MPSSITQVTSWLPKLTVAAVIDILIVAFLIYQLIMVVRGTRAAHVLAGIGVLLLVYAFSAWAGLELLRSILATVVPYTAIALIVLFQSEIRRTLARIGRRRWLGFGGGLQRRESTEDILLALSRLSQQRIGALIVLERDMGLRTFIESGVALDASLSRDLLLSIFQPGGALHDGAVIVQRDRIAAAACFLPLSMNPADGPEARNPPPGRHRHHRGGGLPGAGRLRRNRPHLGGRLRRTGVRCHPEARRGPHRQALQPQAARGAFHCRRSRAGSRSRGRKTREAAR